MFSRSDLQRLLEVASMEARDQLASDARGRRHRRYSALMVANALAIAARGISAMATDAQQDHYSAWLHKYQTEHHAGADGTAAEQLIDLLRAEKIPLLNQELKDSMWRAVKARLEITNPARLGHRND